jgi:hypothetical protein
MHPTQTTTLYFKADPDYGTRVDEGLELDVKEVENLHPWQKKNVQRLLKSKSYSTTVAGPHRRVKKRLCGGILKHFLYSFVTE